MFYTSTDKDKIKVNKVKELLNQTMWAKDWSEEKIAIAMEHSLIYGVFENHTHKQVAFARVITDFATTWYLCDVVVDEQYRKRGIGKMLVDCVTTDHRIKDLPGMLITLDAHGLYNKFGFELNNGMYMNRKGIE